MATTQASNDEALFDSAIESLEAQIANVGTHLTIDSHARAAYAREIKRMSDRLRAEALAGRLSWADAAREAQVARNAIMEVIRSRGTPVGRAIAEYMKKDGIPLNHLVASKTAKAHGSSAVFSRLTGTQQNAIYVSIVTSAGTSNARVTHAMATLSHVSRGVVFIAVALSVYEIATARNKVAAAKKELAVNGAGIAGGIAGGMLAGLACGPAAPVCVTVGAFVGGALAAFGTSYAW